MILVLIYFAGVVFLQGLFLRLTGQTRSEFATVLSTLAIAGVFSPLRVRVQEGIDQRFYRRKFDIEQTLAAFGASLRDEVELVALIGQIEAVIGETLQPERISVWLRPPPAETEGLEY
jgi:hypothetical protein